MLENQGYCAKARADEPRCSIIGCELRKLPRVALIERRASYSRMPWLAVAVPLARSCYAVQISNNIQWL
jgi:hypothetical protein